MNSKKMFTLLGVSFVALILIFQSVYTVDETQTGLLLQLGKPMGDNKGPGLHFKLPLIQNVVLFDARYQQYDAPSAEILTKDKKNMVVDNYAKWRIVDPLKFYQTLSSVKRARARLDDIIYAELRVVLGQYNLDQVVSDKRAEIMSLVTANSNKTMQSNGVEILDVRIKRTDLPPQNEKAIFGRMRAERERQAKLYRSEGQEEMAKIKSLAELEKTTIVAEATKKSEITRGLADAEATRVYSDALGQSPDFYAFARSLEAYKKGFADNTRIILTPGSGFLKYFK